LQQARSECAWGEKTKTQTKTRQDKTRQDKDKTRQDKTTKQERQRKV
jgi:hypothetical protein